MSSRCFSHDECSGCGRAAGARPGLLLPVVGLLSVVMAVTKRASAASRPLNARAPRRVHAAGEHIAEEWESAAEAAIADRSPRCRNRSPLRRSGLAALGSRADRGEREGATRRRVRPGPRRGAARGSAARDRDDRAQASRSRLRRVAAPTPNALRLVMMRQGGGPPARTAPLAHPA